MDSRVGSEVGGLCLINPSQVLFVWARSFSKASMDLRHPRKFQTTFVQDQGTSIQVRKEPDTL